MSEDFPLPELDLFTNPNNIVQEHHHTEYIIHLDDIIQEAHIYRDVCGMLREATSHDTVRVLINTPGGYVASAVQLCHYLTTTQASTTAEIIEACSAGSIIAMHCDKIEVVPFGYMMVHSMSGELSGKTSDIKSHTDFMEHWNEQVISAAYAGFLNKTEIKDVIKGNEMWLYKTDIEQRLKNWVPIRMRKSVK